MEANQIIQAFTEVVRNQDYVFSDVSLDAITELQKTIAGIETEPPEVVAEAIRQWYLDYDYEDVRDAVLLEEREIVCFPRTKPENEENTVKNRYQPLQEEVEKLKEKKNNTMTFEEFSNLLDKQKENYHVLLHNKSISYKGGNKPYVYIKLDNFTWVVIEENQIRNSGNIDKETLLKLETVGQAMFNGYKWMSDNQNFLNNPTRQYMFENNFDPNTMYLH